MAEVEEGEEAETPSSLPLVSGCTRALEEAEGEEKKGGGFSEPLSLPLGSMKKRERERDRERERGEEEKERAWKNQKEKKGDSATEGGGMESRARKHCSASWLNKQPRSCSRAHRAALDGVEKRARKGEEGEERRARNHCRRSRSRAREFFFLFFRRRPSSAVKKASIFPLLVAANVAAASSSTGVHVPPRSPARSGRRSCP